MTMTLQQQTIGNWNRKSNTALPEGDEPLPERASKRPKLSSPAKRKREALDVLEADLESTLEPSIVNHQTDLESALPPVKIDQEAIDEYEAFTASQNAIDGKDEAASDAPKWVKGKSSIYVDAFKLALETVLNEERHLFDEPELEIFNQWQALDYEAQYLYVRLFLRKTAAWHRINSLGYHSDITDMEAAVKTLQRVISLPTSTADDHVHPGELEPPEGTTLGSSFTFADRSETEITTLEQASALLKLDELKAIAKDVKVQGKNKKDLLKGLRRTSQRQAGLVHVGLVRSDSQASRRQSGSNDDDEEEAEIETVNGDDENDDNSNRDTHFLRKIMSEIGPCIRLSLPTLKLFERVHLVFYRSTEWTEKSLTTIILAKISRRNFPTYLVSRSANVFPSRALLLEYEASVRTQFHVDSLLEFAGPSGRDNMDTVLEIFEAVYPRWKSLLKDEQQKEDSLYLSGEGAYLRRLSPAWVYTRIVHKAAYVLGRRKHHQREYDLLVELLDQRLFHPSRRGAWYQRKALLEEHYMAVLNPVDGRSEDAQKKHWKRVALATCENGLQDSLVHIIHHYDLQKRVKKLEKSLRIAMRAQHNFTHVQLTAPLEVFVEGIRIEKEIPSPPSGTRKSDSPIPSNGRRGGKTIWLDPLEGDGECSVEAMCLSHYRSHGWKGYHSEGGIVRTMFAYLFYDIIFAYVPNVFQTPYQTCPLDLHTDAFYPSRLSEINHRLAEIGNGAAENLVRQVWDDHHERETCIIGLDWSYELDDLVEIVNCFKGEALAIICTVMAQEYGQRGGGVPDLFLWSVEKQEVMFAEVKSENDRLSDTQRLWIHVLSSAGSGWSYVMPSQKK